MKMNTKEKQILNYATNSKYCDFYREFYKNIGLDDWEKIPCISKKDIKDYEKSGKKFLFVSDDEVVDIKTTSGTTEDSLGVYLSKKDVEIRDEKFAMGVKANYPDDARIISIFPPNFPGKHLKCFEKYMIVEGDIYSLSNSAEIICRLNINAIRTFPTIALKLGEILQRLDYTKIKLLVLNGEIISELTKKELERKFPDAVVYMLCGMSEFSKTGWQCENIRGNDLYHTVPDYIKYEILNDDEKIKEYGKGELVLTALWMGSAFSLIKYRTGDRAILSKNNCKCGSKGKILSLLGRVSLEGVRVGGITLHKKSMDEAVSSLRGDKEYHVHIYEEKKEGKILPKLVFYIKGDDNEKNIHEIEDKLMENLRLTPNYNWKDGVEKNSLMPVEIRFVPELEKKGWKTLSVIDHRIKGVYSLG